MVAILKNNSFKTRKDTNMVCVATFSQVLVNKERITKKAEEYNIQTLRLVFIQFKAAYIYWY